ncbi:MAG: serine/threonine protein kinase [Steroidobacteraceae bacterium]
MKIIRLVLAAFALVGLAACEGGGVDLDVSNNDNSTDNSTNNPPGDNDNPCASYTPEGSTQAVQGSFDGTNCIYSASFVGASNPLLVDLTIPFISGVHIFQDSLFVGQDVSSGVAPAEGEGPVLTIAAGNTLVFQDASNYVLINRGSQIAANGSPTSPITFTSATDAINGTASANDVQQWGGIVINGNGITNNCTDAQRDAGDCHVESEGQPSFYGGNNNDESSGSLRYVIVKHTGFEVAPDDELNGITFNAVGSGTVVENVQVYSTYDDGLEFFGGAVNVTNAILLYVRDDALDYSDGYSGTIQNALVIQWQSDGNRCIEGDNIGEARSIAGVPLDTAPISAPVVSNMTCITSNTDVNTHGDSEGPVARFGARLTLTDSIIYAGYGDTVNAVTSNECYETESDESLAAASANSDGQFNATNVMVACAEAIKGALANGDALTEWFLGANPSTNGADYSFNTGNFIIADASNANTRVLAAGTFFTEPAFIDEAGATLVADASGYGAVLASDDWTNPWAFGLRESNADVPLWFVP